MAAVHTLLLPLLSMLLFRLIFLLPFRLVILLLFRLVIMLLFRLIKTNLLDPLVLAIRASQKTIKPRVVSTAPCFFHPERVASVLRRVSTWRSSKRLPPLPFPFIFTSPPIPRQTSFLSSLLCAFSSSTASASNLFSTALGPWSDVFDNWNQSAIPVGHYYLNRRTNFCFVNWSGLGGNLIKIKLYYPYFSPPKKGTRRGNFGG